MFILLEQGNEWVDAAAAAAAGSGWVGTRVNKHPPPSELTAHLHRIFVLASPCHYVDTQYGVLTRNMKVGSIPALLS